MNIITGYRGEPHITSYQDRAKNQGSFGTGMYILDVGNKLSASIITANEVRVYDGVLSMQGCVANIQKGMYDSCAIDNGTQGMKRSDLIVARYTKDAGTNVEDISLVVIKGTPSASSPVTPSYNSGDIQQGDSPVDMPLYRVNIDGITISSLSRTANYVKTQAELDSETTFSSASTSWNGITIELKRFGRVITLHMSGSTNDQTTSTNNGSVTLATLSTTYRPGTLFFQRLLITNRIVAQVMVQTNGNIILGYSTDVATGNNTNIPASSSVRVEIAYMSAT